MGAAVLLSMALGGVMLYILREDSGERGYTELYFQNAFEKLSKKRLGEPIVFTIRNNEGEKVAYSYIAGIGYGNYTHKYYAELSTGNVSLGDGESVNITFSIPKSRYKEIIHATHPSVRVGLLMGRHEGFYREIRMSIY